MSTLKGYFLGDDFGLIWLLWEKPASHFLALFAAPWTERIYGYQADELRPTLAFTYWLDARWGPANPLPYHATNVLLHAGSALLVLALARVGAGLGWGWAGFAATLFALGPGHAESVGWISGRADPLPAVFFLGCILAYLRWRASGAPRWYVVSLVACFLALFSKQSTVVLPVALVVFDVLLRAHQVRSVRWWAGYAPYAALAAGYLALRVALFGNAVREETLGPSAVGGFLTRQGAYLLALATGSQQLEWSWATVLVAAGLGATAACLAATVVRGAPGAGGLWRQVALFGPVWWALTMVPLVVVAYFTVRHTYLATAGLAVALAVGLAAGWATQGAAVRVGALAAAALLATGAAVGQQAALVQWQAAGSLSQAIASDTHRVLAAAPEGSLVVLGAPPTGASPRLRTWLWGFAVPFALQPPFAPEGLTHRLHVVTRREVYCCPAQWMDYLRAAVERWRAAPMRSPVVVLAWDTHGRLLQRTSQDDPELASAAEALAAAPGPGETSGALEALLAQLGGEQLRFRLN